MNDTPTHDISESISYLYKTFARYRLNPDMDACPCCVADADKVRLTTQPLRQLSTQDLQHYSRKAISTWGETYDFKHFLPRLFELVAFDNERHLLQPSILLSKLDYAQWTTWEVHEQRAIEKYLDASWQFSLSDYPSPTIAPDTFIEGLIKASSNLTTYLEYWQHLQTPASIRHRVDFILFSQHLAKHSSILQAWLGSPNTTSQLESAFFNYPEFSNEVSAALDVLNMSYS